MLLGMQPLWPEWLRQFVGEVPAEDEPVLPPEDEGDE